MGVSILDDGTKRTDIHTIDSREQEYHLYCVLYVLEGQGGGGAPQTEKLRKFIRNFLDILR